MVPVYEKDDNMGMIVACLWNWFHAPLLEANNAWVKMTLELYWRLLGAKVELSSTMVNGQRVHSIVKLFKKYGTQSTLRKLKIKQEKKLGFVLVTGKHRG